MCELFDIGNGLMLVISSRFARLYSWHDFPTVYFQKHAFVGYLFETMHCVFLLGDEGAGGFGLTMRLAEGLLRR